MVMSSYFLRSVFVGLTSCLFLVLFSGCGTEKGSAKESPDTWEASTWNVDSFGPIFGNYTFSGGNSGRFSKSNSGNAFNTGTYTYVKTAKNTGRLTLIEDLTADVISLDLVFNTKTGGRGTAVIPGQQAFEFVFHRI